MDEVKFVIKTLFVSIIVLFALQIKVGNSTVETQALEWIETSSTTRYLQNVAAGAVLAIRNAGKTASGYLGKTFQQDTKEANRASRFNFDFKRSPQAARTQQHHQSEGEQ